MLGRCLGLVEARQPAIMALVKMPVLFNRQPEPPHFLQRQIQRLDRAGLYRGEAAVEVETPFSHQFSCRAGFFRALFRHIDIPPASETDFQIPGGLAMADKDKCRHRSDERRVGREWASPFRSRWWPNT